MQFGIGPAIGRLLRPPSRSRSREDLAAIEERMPVSPAVRAPVGGSGIR
jgi:hypothetical protein